MAGLLGNIFSTIDTQKRKLTDLLGNPVESLQQIVGNVNDRARNLNQLTAAAAQEKDLYGPKSQQLASLLAEAYNPIGLTVYHGSPAKFSKFDPTKIGSGEGAQAYGYGHYVAESPDVAKEYQANLSRDLVEPAKMALKKAGGNVDDAIRAANKEIQRLNALDLTPSTGSAKRDALVATQMSNIDELSKFKKSGDWTAGSLYEIDLPDEQIAKMLDWDKPLMQQSKEIQSLAKQYGLTDADHLGGDLIAAMDAKRAAGAEAMRQAGVPGIKYFDAQSRGTAGGELIGVTKTPDGWKSKVKVVNRGSTQFQSPSDTITTSMPFKTEKEALDWANEKIATGTSNFVVFPGNEDLLTILERNGGLLGP